MSSSNRIHGNIMVTWSVLCVLMWFTNYCKLFHLLPELLVGGTKPECFRRMNLVTESMVTYMYTHDLYILCVLAWFTNCKLFHFLPELLVGVTKTAMATPLILKECRWSSYSYWGWQMEERKRMTTCQINLSVKLLMVFPTQNPPKRDGFLAGGQWLVRRERNQNLVGIVVKERGRRLKLTWEKKDCRLHLQTITEDSLCYTKWGTPLVWGLEKKVLEKAYVNKYNIMVPILICIRCSKLLITSVHLGQGRIAPVSLSLKEGMLHFVGHGIKVDVTVTLRVHSSWFAHMHLRNSIWDCYCM